MKKIWISIVILILLISCENSINITPPIILIENSSPSVSDEIKIRVEEYADVDGNRINADYFDWSVEDADGHAIEDDFIDSSAIKWIPEEAGYYIIKVKIGYDKNKSITALREINVSEIVGSLMPKLAGHWKGTGTRFWDNATWGIDLYIDSTGHYHGKADFTFNPYCESGVFHSGRLDYFTDWTFDSCGIPGELPCQRLELTDVIENKGKGVVWIGSIEYNNGELANQGCNDLYIIEDLELIENGNTLYFEFNYKGTSISEEWIMKFNLTRQ